MKLRPLSLGIAVGIVWGLGVLLATIRAVQIHGGATLILLRKFFPGYTVSPGGCVLGMIWGFVYGFLVAVAIAGLYNYFVDTIEPKR